MPDIQPIPAITYNLAVGRDVSDRIAPPYDVLTEVSKPQLVAQSEHNIVVVDLPHLPAKTVGPDIAYEQAGRTFHDWLKQGVLVHRERPAFFVYEQSYTVAGERFDRRGVIANVALQPFGKAPDGRGGIHPHELTFPGAKEDRLKLMRATGAQLSPIFGLYSDPDRALAPLLARIVEAGPPTFHGTTANDGVEHKVWAVDDAQGVAALRETLGEKDIYIADGHHRYTTALNYRQELLDQGKDPGHANYCLFVLVSMQDPGMIVLPTHRVLGNMPRFTMPAFNEAAEGRLEIEPGPGGDISALQQAVNDHPHPHAIGLYDPAQPYAPFHIVTTVDADPLAARFADRSEAWRQLDVAIVQHLIVEEICQPRFCEPGESVTWKFPHELDQLVKDVASPGYQLGLVLRATPLASVRQVSEAGEVMPQKSTFFYPKLATGLVINPISHG